MFCRSASKSFFRVVDATLPFDADEECTHLEKLFQISCSTYAISVRELNVGFDSVFTSSFIEVNYIRDLASLLPLCLSRFPGLAVLNFRGPKTPRRYREFEKTSEFPEHLMRTFTNTVVKALRYVPLPALKELSLRFPVTFEFGQFFSPQMPETGVPIQSIMQRLRKLTVKVCDSTGTDGTWRDSFLPLSEVKQNFPNQTHASELFKFVGLAKNLESLHISSTDILDLDGVSFSHMMCLKSLKLSHFKVSSQNLLSIVEQRERSMTCIHFVRVELKSGKWQDILTRLSRLSSLHQSHIKSCGYSSTGESSDLMNPIARDDDHPENIETLDSVDYDALQSLERQINAKRRVANLPEQPWIYFQWIDQDLSETVESDG
jgi:hypothetical protein